MYKVLILNMDIISIVWKKQQQRNKQIAACDASLVIMENDSF